MTEKQRYIPEHIPGVAIDLRAFLANQEGLEVCRKGGTKTEPLSGRHDKLKACRLTLGDKRRPKVLTWSIIGTRWTLRIEAYGLDAVKLVRLTEGFLKDKEWTLAFKPIYHWKRIKEVS